MVLADAAIMRRLWPARGMVVDPGLHGFHWMGQQAIDYIVSSAHFTADEANDYVARIAVMPGQLIAYDCGGLEIRELRSKAEAPLGVDLTYDAFTPPCLREASFRLRNCAFTLRHGLHRNYHPN